MGRKRRKHNVGQLLREQCGFNNTFNIGTAHTRPAFSLASGFFLIECTRAPGFTTYTGTVSAASGWGKPLQKKNVVPGRKDRYDLSPGPSCVCRVSCRVG
jgi:hypothetical protein